MPPERFSWLVATKISPCESSLKESSTRRAGIYLHFKNKEELFDSLGTSRSCLRKAELWALTSFSIPPTIGLPLIRGTPRWPASAPSSKASTWFARQIRDCRPHSIIRADGWRQWIITRPPTMRWSHRFTPEAHVLSTLGSLTGLPGCAWPSLPY